MGTRWRSANSLETCCNDMPYAKVLDLQRRHSATISSQEVNEERCRNLSSSIYASDYAFSAEEDSQIAVLQAQFAAAGRDIIGIHESRARKPSSRHTKDFLVISSGATAKGHLGCELWVKRKVEVSDDLEINVTMRMLHVLHYDERTLLVAIDALLRSGRVEAAISVLERELGGGC